MVSSHTNLKPLGRVSEGAGLEKLPGLRMDYPARPSPLSPYTLTRLGASQGRWTPEPIPRTWSRTAPHPGKNPDMGPCGLKEKGWG
ncbi:MAG: hypothetical protein QXX57_01415 [Nitrososphaerota archaeon]